MSHVWPYQEWLDADRACFMSRQYIHSSLFQRLSTRPFLTQAEKVGNTSSGCSAHLVIDSVPSVMLCGGAGRQQHLLGGALRLTCMLVQPAPAPEVLHFQTQTVKLWQHSEDSFLPLSGRQSLM